MDMLSQDNASSPLPERARTVVAAAARLGLTLDVHTTTQTTRTAEEAAVVHGVAVGAIVKSLIFEGAETGKPYLFLVSGQNRVNETGVTAILGEGLKRPNAARVRELTGFAIGGIPPFGHATDMATYIDQDLMAFDVVWAAAGTPFANFPIAPQDLVQALKAPLIAVT
ncbi:YbaK/EbsC family protein [Chelatococcus asaccharovorans]|uniref:YbaK/EbsC family protein n=1 Tax=Chelatococcus asaccharovorans TaxID=28210 RepID=UPI00224C6C2B|nr:YbaK/EbsC family protein [Chelatococcus asaccharovorans]CAH1663545.1 Prolyl-tRNA editing enzyme YbaK/EbsC (Cys-tRNA(Pro) deacylase) [Chelatococcus asaccharovorans]CAH1682782.1 Prolyl-tRNA editing enzyme YbaK/EbsC (Cys-tRNA(Pro) deacylase) [Chelatococcus asaccharovorans]